MTINKNLYDAIFNLIEDMKDNDGPGFIPDDDIAFTLLALMPGQPMLLFGPDEAE